MSKMPWDDAPEVTEQSQPMPWDDAPEVTEQSQPMPWDEQTPTPSGAVAPVVPVPSPATPGVGRALAGAVSPDMIKTGVRPVMDAAKNVTSMYLSNPAKLAADIATSKLTPLGPVNAMPHIQDAINTYKQFGANMINNIGSGQGAFNFGGPAGANASKAAAFGKVLGPIAATAGRVLGPAGYAANAYEAKQFTDQAKLGERLGAGEGRRAEQAFRNRNTQYGASITPDQARAVLESGSKRDIESFGGVAKLQQIAQGG